MLVSEVGTTGLCALPEVLSRARQHIHSSGAKMHELSITQSVLDIVTDHAERAGAQRVVKINLVVGDLTGFVDDSIQFYFDMLSPDTLAAGAQLAIQRIPPRVRCRACGSEFEPQDLNWACPQCAAIGGDILSGQEFRVESIEVE